MQSLIQNTGITPADTLMIHIYKGTGENNFVYYEDDGRSFDYEKGFFYKRNISYNGNNNVLVIGKAEGNYKTKFNNISLVLHGFDDTKAITINGAPAEVRNSKTSLLSSIDTTDPLGVTIEPASSNTKTVSFKNSNDIIRITL